MSGFAIPTLRTARLVLRAFREADWAAYAAMLGDADVVRFLGDGRPRDADAAWAAMARGVGQWGLRGTGMWAIEAPDGGFAGHVGLLHPHAWAEPELAYAIAPGWQGQGFATEAAQAVRLWAARARGIVAPVSYIRPANAASIAVARKLGAQMEATLELVGAPALRFRHAAAQGAVTATGATLIEMPALQTRRLGIRGFTAGDFAPLCAIHADPEVMRHLGDGMPRDAAATWNNMVTWLGGWGLRGTGYLAVTEAATGVLIGRAGVLDMPGWPAPELGYTLARASWGQGLAQEAAAAIRDWAWRSLRPRQLCSLVKQGNDASSHVARRLGATWAGTIAFEGKPTERWDYAPPTAW